MKKKKLIELIAFICYTATMHTVDWEIGFVEGCENIDWEKYFQCTSFTISCLLYKEAKVLDGVESDIVLNELCQRPVKSLQEWEKIAEDLVDEFHEE
jgi:hypothetical protein